MKGLEGTQRTRGTHSNDTSVATSDATPQTIIVASVNLEPVPPLDASCGILNDGKIGGKLRRGGVMPKQ